MDRYQCTRCREEFYAKTTCSCCSPPPGPHFCPECGGVLRLMTPSYVCSREFDEE